MYKHLYLNPLCEMLMNDRNNIDWFSILKYYDLFSLRGFLNWVQELFSIWFMWPLELYKLIVRFESGNWRFWQYSSYNEVDMNRLLYLKGDTDAYDYGYYE